MVRYGRVNRRASSTWRAFSLLTVGAALGCVVKGIGCEIAGNGRGTASFCAVVNRL